MGFAVICAGRELGISRTLIGPKHKPHKIRDIVSELTSHDMISLLWTEPLTGYRCESA